MTDRSKEATGAPLSQSEETGGMVDLEAIRRLRWASQSGPLSKEDEIAIIFDALPALIAEVERLRAALARSAAQQPERERQALRVAATLCDELNGEDIHEFAYYRLVERTGRDRGEDPTPDDYADAFVDLANADRPAVLRAPEPTPTSGTPAEDVVDEIVMSERIWNTDSARENRAAVIRAILRKHLSGAEPPASGGQEEHWYITAEWVNDGHHRQLTLTKMPFDEHDEPVTLLRAAAPASGGWRPIEEAPKDGTRVLIVGLSGYVTTAQFCADGYWRGRVDQPKEQAFEPTHWMPLPPAPVSTPDLEKKP